MSEQEIRTDERRRIVNLLREHKARVFSDAHTWRSSGEPYASSANQQELGWDKARELIEGVT
jgi:hypothetical protein